jgi:PAS domain S-box-containing protein
MEQVTTSTPTTAPTTTTPPAPAAGTTPPVTAPMARLAALAKFAAPFGRRGQWLLRGESVVASIGVALAAILLGAMGASAWWIARTTSATSEGARTEQLRTVGDLTSQNVEALLSAGELPAVRRMLSETGAAYNLSNCRVVLANGQVVAAADASQITAQKLPKSWTRTRPLDDSVATAPAGSVALTYPLKVPGRGDADLEIVAPLSKEGWATWEALAGVGTIGAVSMGGLLLTYRTMRGRIRAAGLIREALLALEAGETSTAALMVSDTLGPEARVWNGIVAEREQARKHGVAERARETLGSRGQAKGDLSAACDAMSQGLVLIDEKNTVTYANGAAAVFLRAKRDELLGSEVSKFLQVEPVLQSVKDIVSGAQRRRTVHDIERGGSENGDGAGVLRFNVRPVRRDDAAAAMVTIDDITQQKVAEEARHAFVAQATHELRTPLTNIRLYVETAIEDGEKDPKMRSKCLNVINGETRRLERIVGEMLSVAEIEAGSFKLKTDDVTLQTVFEELEADYKAQAKEKKIKLTFNLPPKLPQLKGDRDKIVLALHNLVGNALKYTPDGGRVDVNVTGKAKQLVVEVQDSGIGISPEDAERIFERFYRAKDPRVGKITGTGLGLTIAREVVRLHGGDVTVESQVNQGSTFTMSLPLVAAEAA